MTWGRTAVALKWAGGAAVKIQRIGAPESYQQPHAVPV